MDKSFDQQNSVRQKPNGFLAILQMIDGILTWLESFVQLTEEEEREAGIYLGESYQPDDLTCIFNRNKHYYKEEHHDQRE